MRRQGGDEYALVVQTQGKAFRSLALWPFYNSFHSAINALEVAPVSADKKEEGLKALKDRSRKQVQSAMNGVQFDEEAKAAVMSEYEAHLAGQELDFEVKRVGISTGLFVPFHGGTEWETALQHADEAQDSAKLHGKNQLRVYYGEYFEKRKEMAPAEMLQAEYGCDGYTRKIK